MDGVNVSETLSASQFAALSPGTHTVYVHGKDIEGNWGATVSATFVVKGATNTPTPTPTTPTPTPTTPTPTTPTPTTPTPTTPTPTTPTPTPITTTPSPVSSKKGVTGVSVAFNQPLNSASASNLGLYQILEGVKKKRKTVYTKPLKIKNVNYVASSNSVTINLTKPFKGKIEVIVDGAIEALDGTMTDVDFSNIIT